MISSSPNINLKFKIFIKDTLYVSKVTKTSNKKVLILTAVVLSQLSAFTDILIILFFTYFITNTVSSSEFLINILLNIFSFPILLPVIIVLRYLFNYFQIMIIKKLELNVQKNLKVHLLKQVFEKRNYSVADAYFYINTLTTHISYFYSSFASFLNYLLQIVFFTVYLSFTNLKLVSTFGLGILILLYPILLLLKKARELMHNSYIYGQDSNIEIQRVVDNMFLIKLLQKEDEETSKFENTLKKYNDNVYRNQKYGVINSFLPSFFTLVILSIATLFTKLANSISLDLIGISLRLFQSIGNLTTSVNQIINSHVHLEKFYEIEKSKIKINKENFLFLSSSKNEIIRMETVSFRYANSNEFIFTNLNCSIPKGSHTLLTGSNGSGKSTFLGLAAGVYYPESGKVFNNALTTGYVGPSPIIFTASLRDNLLYGNKQKIEDSEINNLLKDFKTFELDNDNILDRIIDNKSISSGQAQKIAFMRALLMDIDLLILDESTSNLDDSSKDLIFDILKNYNLSIINSTHNPTSFLDADHHLEISFQENQRTIFQIK